MLTAEKAKFIIDLDDHVEVLFKGNNVWLESVNESDNTATVRILENRQTIDVPLNDLEVTGRELK